MFLSKLYNCSSVYFSAILDYPFFLYSIIAEILYLCEYPTSLVLWLVLIVHGILDIISDSLKRFAKEENRMQKTKNGLFWKKSQCLWE